MTNAKQMLLGVLCVLLAACDGPTLSLHFSQRYEIRDEERAFNWLRSWHGLDEGLACFWQTGLETPSCAMPWEDLFNVLPAEQNPTRYYLQGQSSTETIDLDGTASLKSLCSDATERFEFSAAERRTIGNIASAYGFFDLPADLSKLPPVLHADGLDTIVIRDTCGTSDLELTFEGRRNHVHWRCDTALDLGQDDAPAPQQIQAVLTAIEKAYAAHAPVKTLLPFARCPTMFEELARREKIRNADPQ